MVDLGAIDQHDLGSGHHSRHSYAQLGLLATEGEAAETPDRWVEHACAAERCGAKCHVATQRVAHRAGLGKSGIGASDDPEKLRRKPRRGWLRPEWAGMAAR